MGSIRHKPAAGVLRGLEPICQAVEFLSDLSDLIVAPDLRPMTVGALPDLTDRGQQQGDLPGQSAGQHTAETQHCCADDGRQPQEVGLQSFQQSALKRVVLIGIHRADDLILVQYRRGGPGAERPAAVTARKGIIAPKGLNDLCVKTVLPYGTAGLPGIIEDPAGVVGDQDTAQA